MDDIEYCEENIDFDSDEDIYESRRKRKHDDGDSDDFKPKQFKCNTTVSLISTNEDDDDIISSDDAKSDISDLNDDDIPAFKYLQFEHIAVDLYSNVLEQVCLEGLDGITLEALWKRLIDSVNYPIILDDGLKEKMWNFMLMCNTLKFYLLPEARSDLLIFDRYQYLDPDLGMVIEPDEYPINIYPHKCINDTEENVIGSCPSYCTREEVTERIKKLSCLQADKLYSTKLVVVASQLLRTNYLMNDLLDPCVELTEVQYCILERIGRSRGYGEITQGKLSLQEICNDAKMMFYNRGVLKKQHLINKQLFYLKTSVVHHTTGSLLHLQRYYNQKKLKMQIITEKIVEYLRRRSPKNIEYSHLKKRFGSMGSIKKLLKTSDFQRFVQTDINTTYRELYPQADREEWKVKGREKERRVRVLKLREPAVNVSAVWHEDYDEEESSDDENLGDICINLVLLNQIFHIIYDTGPDGISIKDLETIVGIDYYTVRAVLIMLINRKCISSYKIDNKRQKIIKYHASCFNKWDACKDIERYDNMRKTAKINSLCKFKNAIKKSNGTSDLNINVVSLNKLNEENSLETISKKTEESFINVFIKIPNEISPMFLNINFDKQFYETAEALEEAEYNCVSLNKKNGISYIIILSNKINKQHKNIKYFIKKRCKLSTSNRLLIEALQEGFDSVKEKLFESPSDYELREVSSDERICEANEKLMFKDLSNIVSILGPKPVLIKHEFIEDKIEFQMLMSTKPHHYKSINSCYHAKDRSQSKRFVARANIVINTLKHERIVLDPTKFSKIISKIEKNNNYNVRVDRKSIERILIALVESGHIKIIQIIMKCDKITRIKNIICEPTVSLDHTEIISLIEQLKLKCFATSKRKNECVTENTVMDDFSEQQITTATFKKVKHDRNVKLIYDKNIGKQYGYSPKFIRMKLLHTFLYHLVYGCKHEIINSEDVKAFYESNNIILTPEEFNKYSKIYNMEIDWRMFIPPLPENKNLPHGWILISDILLRLPLFLLVKLCNIKYQVPNLYNYLNHPIKKYALIKSLPMQMRNVLLHHRKYIHSIYETLVHLNGIGLLQFGPHPYKEKDQMYIYFNRRAILYNTTISGPGYRTISEKEYEKISFEFSSQSDVLNYWLKMCSICLHTRLGNISFVSKEAKYIRKDVTVIESKSYEDALLNDIGYVPGDNKGAAGFDSSLWPHLKRNWTWNLPKVKNTKQIKPEPASNVRKRKIDKINYKPIKFDEIKIQNKKKTQVVLKKLLSPNTKKRRLKEKLMIEEKRIKEREKLVKMKKDQDLIDRRIMNRIARCRVMWTKQEDQILTLCKVVSKFLAPDSHKQMIPYFLIRNMVHRFCPKISSNKTSMACLRRMAWLSKRSKKSGQNLMTKIDLLSKIPHVKKFYDDFKENIQKENAPKEKLFSDAFVYLINYLHKEDFNKLIKKNEERNMIRDKLTNTNLKKYCKHELNQCIYFDVKNDLDISLDVIKSVVLSFLGGTDSGNKITHQFLSLNQIFSDDKLREALNVLRKHNVIVKNQSFSKSDSSSRPFRFSFNYIFAQITKYPVNCYSQTHDFLLKLKDYLEINPNPRFTLIFDAVKPFEQGHNIGLCELTSLRSIDICVELPEEVLILNPSIEDHTEVIKELALRYKYIISKKHKTRKSPKIKELHDNPNETDDKNDKNFKDDKGNKSSCVTMKDIVQKVLRAYDSQNQQEREDIERSLELEMHVITEKQHEDVLENPEEDTSINNEDIEDKDEESFSSESENEDLPVPSVSDIMEGMMEDKPEESRTIPHITDLTCLLTQGLIPELDKDQAWLEKLRDHFVMICPTSKMLLEKNIFNNDTTTIIKNQDERRTKLYNKLKTDLIIKKQPPVDYVVVKSKLSQMGANEVDLINTKILIDFIGTQKHFGVTPKEITENFDEKLGNMGLCEILDVLIELGFIFRFGITCIRFVHRDFKDVWLVDKCSVGKQKNFQIDVDETEHIRVMPWSQINGSLNVRVILIWMCVILTRCLITSYTSFETLVTKYYFLKPVDIFYILECLQMLGCVEMVTRKKKNNSLFTELNEDLMTEEKATFLSDFDEILIKCDWMAMTIFGGFINDYIKYGETNLEEFEVIIKSVFEYLRENLEA